MNSNKFFALSLALAAAGTAFAAGTPANTKIRNQAIADFTDSDGVRQTTKSNEVFTVVQPVYSYTITPDEVSTGSIPARSASVPNTGAPRYFAYYITNSGNATDIIHLSSSVTNTSLTGTPSFKLYYDANSNGQVDSGEVEVSKDGVGYYISVDADKTVNLVAEVKMPVQATVAAGARADFNLLGDSDNIPNPATPGVTDESGNQKNTVRVNVSNDAGFQILKDANLPDLVARNSNLTYTISGSNNGATPASAVSVSVKTGATTETRYGILIEDSLPTDGATPTPRQLEFLTAALSTTATGSNYVYSGRGVAVPLYKVSGSWQTTFSTSATAVGVLIQNDAAGLTDPGAFFQPGDQFTLVFTSRVDNDSDSTNTADPTILSANTAINNTAQITFKKNSQDLAGTTTPSNTRTNHVAPDYKVAVGQDDSATPGTQALDNNGAAETYTGGGNAYTGQSYTWTVYLTNNGNTSDLVRLNTVLGVNSNLTNVTLSYTNGTSIVANDPISIPAGTTIQVRVTGTIPLNAPTGGINVAQVTLQADSSNVAGSIGATGKSVTVAGDAADDVLLKSPVITSPYGVDAAVDDNTTSKTGDGNTANDSTDITSADAAPYYKVNPGSTGYYPIEIKNTGATSDSYDITVPTGVTVHTFTDSNGNGKWDVGEPIGSALSTTAQLPAGSAVNLVLRDPIGSTQIPGNVTVPVTVTSTTNPTGTSDTFNVVFQVQANTTVTFTPDRTGSVVPGGVTTYTHTVSNNGNTYVQFDLGAAGTNGTSDKGLIYTYSTDNGATYVIDPAANAICLAPNSSVSLMVRVEAPSNVAIGTVDPEQLSGVASFFSNVGCTTTVTGTTPTPLSVTDTTTVVGTLIKVEKQVRNVTKGGTFSTSNTAEPGDTLEYKIDAFNNGNLDVYGLVISDKLPQYTDLDSFEVSTASMVAGTKVFVSNDYDPLTPGAATWSSYTTMAGLDGIVSATEWKNAFGGATFNTLYVGFDTDGDGKVEMVKVPDPLDLTNTPDKIAPAKGATVLFRVKVQ